MGTRDEILDAAAEVLRTQGYARATTKSIAQVAGYSEAALYKHFADKAAILLAVLHERMPELPGSLKELNAGPHRAQEGLVRYLREEQKLGRIRRTADVPAAAALLFGACFQRGFEVNYTGITPSGEDTAKYAAALTKTLYESLRPAPAAVQSNG